MPIRQNKMILIAIITAFQIMTRLRMSFLLCQITKSLQNVFDFFLLINFYRSSKSTLLSVFVREFWLFLFSCVEVWDRRAWWGPFCTIETPEVERTKRSGRSTRCCRPDSHGTRSQGWQPLKTKKKWFKNWNCPVITYVCPRRHLI